jgi:HK97 family phage major capsid protein
MNPILKRLRARGAHLVDGVSAMAYTLALPAVLAMAMLAEHPRLGPLREQRRSVQQRLDVLMGKVGVSGRDKLLASEQRQYDANMAARQALDERIAELLDSEKREQAAADAAGSIARAGGAGGGISGRGGWNYEGRTYRPDVRDYGYVSDLIRRQLWNDSGAHERLARHAQEVENEQRAISRVDGAGGEFVPPLWLMDAYAAFARPGRVTADLCNVTDLPPGTDSLNIPKVTGGATVAAQTADNAAVSNTDMTTSTVTAPVRTLAGEQTVALQLLEQSPIAFDEVVFKDLLADHARSLGGQVLAGSGTAGTLQGITTLGSINTTTYTDASPTLPELYVKVASAINDVIVNRQLPPEAIVMHSRRWVWMLSSLDNSNRPLVVPSQNGPNNAAATAGALNTAGTPVGMLLGLPVYVDNNITTTNGAGTEDVIVIGRFSDAFLFEGQPKMRVLPEVVSATLSVKIQVYSYVAFAPGRFPKSFSVISGSGLIAPAF